MQDCNKYFLGKEEQSAVMCVHVLDVHIHLQKWNLESCFSAKPGFMRLVVSTSSQEHFKHLFRSGWTGHVSSLASSVDSSKAQYLRMAAEALAACLEDGWRKLGSWLSPFSLPAGQPLAYKV